MWVQTTQALPDDDTYCWGWDGHDILLVCLSAPPLSLPAGWWYEDHLLPVERIRAWWAIERPPPPE